MVINFEECSNIFEMADVVRGLAENEAYYIDAKAVNIVKNDYEKAISAIRCGLQFIKEEIISEEDFAEVDKCFANIITNAVQGANTAKAYADDTQQILSFIAGAKELLEKAGISLELRDSK